MKPKSAFPYFGGKSRLIPSLLPLLPPSDTYDILCDVCCGSSALLFGVEPKSVEVINDIDSEVANFYRVLQNEKLFKELLKRLRNTPYARSEWQVSRRRTHYSKRKNDPCKVERARRFFILSRQSMGGVLGESFGYSVTKSNRGMASTTSAWLSAIEGLPEVRERILRVQVEQLDLLTLLRRFNNDRVFNFIDPPYPQETRKRGSYEHEFTAAHYQNLFRTLLDTESKVMLCGYDHEMYAPLTEANWRVERFDTVCHAAGKTRQNGVLGKGSVKERRGRTEVVWMNYREDGTRINY